MSDAAQEPPPASPHAEGSDPVAEKLESQRAEASGSRLLIEFGPLLAFFLSNYLWGIMVATAVLMVAMIPSLAASWVLERRFPPMALTTFVMVLVFGGLTLYLDDELFIKVKPTIVNMIFAVVLSVGLLLKRPLIQLVMGQAFQLSDEGWRRLTVRFVYLFIGLAIINEVVWRNFTTDTWVSFKVFGIMPITLIYTMCQVPLIQKYQLEESAPAGK